MSAVKLEDIAKRENVSVVTVSNALAGRSGVSEEVRERIIRTANELGYRKKKRREKGSVRAAQSTAKSWKIGVAVSELYLKEHTSFYWEQYQHLASEASRRGHFVMLEVLPEETVQAQALPLMVQNKSVDALIALGTLPEEYLRMLYETSGCQMLLLDSDVENLPCDTVLSNGFFGMYQMTNYLIREGHTRIGFVGEYHATNSIMDRYQGYSKALMERGITENPEWVISDRDVRTGAEAIVLPEKLPTAFACNCDCTAERLAMRLMEAGYRIPEDISLVGYDDYLTGGALFGKLTTYAVDMDAMAEQSLKLLEKRLNGEQCEKMVRVIDGKMLIRSSVKHRKRGEKRHGDRIR